MFFFEPSNSKDAQSFSPPKSMKHAGRSEIATARTVEADCAIDTEQSTATHSHWRVSKIASQAGSFSGHEEWG
jgi:hypothetical protein